MNRLMKKAIGVIAAMIIAVSSMMVTGIESFAVDTVDVTGTVKSGSTSTLIKLDCDGSEMKIKVDDSTDFTDCKILLQGTKINVSVYVGSDKYLHAAKVSASANATASSTSGSVIISGSIKDGTTSSLIKLSTILGDFEIKFDNATDVSGCKMLAVGRNVIITCGKDKSGALYATKIEDGSNKASTSTNSSSTTSISGKITSSSTENVLYLNNSTGTITVKLDEDTQVPKAVVLATDSTVTATVYTGADGSLHAEKLVQTRSANSYTVDNSKLYKITGTVAEGSTTDMLKFDMGDGTVMNLKLDDNTQCTNGIILTKGKKVTVTCGRGSDAYMHAVKIDKAD